MEIVNYNSNNFRRKLIITKNMIGTFNVHDGMITAT